MRAFLSFWVSWSLCIEEHFYLFVPALLTLVRRWNGVFHWAFTAGILVSPVSRWLVSVEGLNPTFGFAMTATHFRMEGLLLGFWVAYLPHFTPVSFGRLKTVCRWLSIPALVILAGMPFLSEASMYRTGLTVLALLYTVILISQVDRKASFIARHKITKAIALASYSLYLIHALMIHLALKCTARLETLLVPSYLAVGLLLIALGGAACYFTVERSAIALRDRTFPRRVA